MKCLNHIACPEVHGEDAQQLGHSVNSSFSLSRVLLSVLSERKIPAKINTTFARYQVFNPAYLRFRS